MKNGNVIRKKGVGRLPIYPAVIYHTEWNPKNSDDKKFKDPGG